MSIEQNLNNEAINKVLSDHLEKGFNILIYLVNFLHSSKKSFIIHILQSISYRIHTKCQNTDQERLMDDLSSYIPFHLNSKSN